MTVVNYSKCINYCEISINCFTSKKFKFKISICFFHFATTIFCLKFACGDDAETEQNCAGMGIGARPAGTKWGWGQSLRDGVGMGTVFGNGVGIGKEQLSPCSSPRWRLFGTTTTRRTFYSLYVTLTSKIVALECFRLLKLAAAAAAAVGLRRWPWVRLQLRRLPKLPGAITAAAGVLEDAVSGRIKKMVYSR